MPLRAPSPCSSPGCPALAVERGRCAQHRRVNTRSSAALGYGYGWQQKRARFLREHPICEECRVVPATEVHHLLPKRDGGSDDPMNLSALCVRCHSRLTMMDTRRAGRL